MSPAEQRKMAAELKAKASAELSHIQRQLSQLSTFEWYQGVLIGKDRTESSFSSIAINFLL
jgi:hypothetical protein